MESRRNNDSQANQYRRMPQINVLIFYAISVFFMYSMLHQEKRMSTYFSGAVTGRNFVVLERSDRGGTFVRRDPARKNGSDNNTPRLEKPVQRRSSQNNELEENTNAIAMSTRREPESKERRDETNTAEMAFVQRSPEARKEKENDATRVSCDSDTNEMYRVPALIVAGTQKGGTTAVFEYLSQHPRMAQTEVLETHFFDRILDRTYDIPSRRERFRGGKVGARRDEFGRGSRRFRNENHDEVFPHTEPLDSRMIAIQKKFRRRDRERYDVPFNKKNRPDPRRPHYDVSKSSRTNFVSYSSIWAKHKHDPTVLAFEKTPFYIFDPDVPRRVHDTVPWSKVLFLLREPVERAYSAFKMNYHQEMQKKEIRSAARQQRRSKQAATFDECVTVDIGHLKRAKILYNDSFWKTSEKEQDLRWAFYFKNWTEKPRNCDGEIGRGLYSLQLRRWMNVYGPQDFRCRALVLRSESMRPDPISGMIDLEPITNFLGISPMRAQDKNVHAAKIFSYPPLTEETKLMLSKLFQPFNEDLHSLLGDDWKDPWPYNITE